ncbi:glycosyltransferase family 71 protein [Sporormia fimetaria CBS 119925]|uniref:Glycosyltransferase family 71 protein n=1 Tax=Sporormia fimetaria CBS 119925 TaxID=1340428 RepID=A0A6A6VKZ3_9PLEO|nr:glycosyltransferase family 71 protein [Sporormia fimetaria CBS 119925]
MNTLKSIPNRLKDFTAADESALAWSHYSMRLSAQRLGSMLPFEDGATGIVTTAGGKYLPVVIVSIRMLRRTGSRLPVEIFLDSPAEYDATICEEVLPSLDAGCRIISEMYEAAPNATAPSQYQFKIFSILFSSFQHVLFLDADAYPAHDPAPLFTKAPYTTHGLITWPDFWGSTASEHFYHIAGLPPVAPYTRYASESGQLMLDKEKHRESLLMMVYYNYYGPDYFFHLLSQGGPGSGDKDTFLPAAMVMDAPFYQVRTSLHVIGRFGTKKEGEISVAAMGQVDPVADFQYKPPHKSHIHEAGAWSESFKSRPLGNSDVPEKPKSFFVHTSMFKINPLKVLDPKGMAITSDGKHVRMYSSRDDAKDMVKEFGYDLEKRLWEVIGEEACRMDAEACKKVAEHLEIVFGNARD